MKRGRRLKDLPSNNPPEPDLGPKPETEWSRFRCTKATVEEQAEELCRGVLTVAASDRAGASQLYGAIIKKPDLTLRTTNGERQEYGKITRLVITNGKKPDTIHAVATITTAPHVEDLVGRALKIETRQIDLPMTESESQTT